MGVSKTPAEYAAKMRLAERAAVAAGKEGTEAGALLVKRSVLALAPAQLRGVGKNGRKIGVRYNVSHEGDVTKALVFATGPFQLIERDTKAHRIPRERGPRARRRVVVIPGVGVRAWANHPGTHGKHPFEKGVVAASGLIGRQQLLQLGTRLKAIF